MCSHYQAEKRRKQIEKHFGIKLPPDWEPPPGGLHIYPSYMAPFIRRPPARESDDEAIPAFELGEGYFGLLPSWAEDTRYCKNTYNARIETVATKASYKGAWAKPRHCIVLCQAIYEPDWRPGTPVPTRFTRADDETLGVAGLWWPWKDPRTNAWKDSFTMLTINAANHPQFMHMHRPEDEKRMAVILPEAQYEEWLDAPPERSMDFMKPYPAEGLTMTPEPPPPKAAKPKPARPFSPPEQGGLF
jgi:putative SOS response-associated peptidase YedK